MAMVPAPVKRSKLLKIPRDKLCPGNPETVAQGLLTGPFSMSMWQYV